MVKIFKKFAALLLTCVMLAGSALVALLVFISYNFKLDQLINSNYLSIEIAQSLCGTFGIVLSVPATAVIAAVSLKKE